MLGRSRGPRVPRGKVHETPLRNFMKMSIAIPYQFAPDVISKKFFSARSTKSWSLLLMYNQEITCASRLGFIFIFIFMTEIYLGEVWYQVYMCVPGFLKNIVWACIVPKLYYCLMPNFWRHNKSGLNSKCALHPFVRFCDACQPKQSLCYWLYILVTSDFCF